MRGRGKSLEFVVDAPNCVHCMTCDIKDPKFKIASAVLERGGSELLKYVLYYSELEYYEHEIV